MPHANYEFECEGLEGMSLRDVAEHGQGVGAQTLREYIECACSGVMACSTCHVVVHPDSFHIVGSPGEAEEVRADSRCTCISGVSSRPWRVRGVHVVLLTWRTRCCVGAGHAGPGARKEANVEAGLPAHPRRAHAGHGGVHP